MTKTFNTVGIIGKYSDSTIGGTISTLANFLLDRGVEVRLEQNTADNLPSLRSLNPTPLAELGEHCDLAIVVGGDGTLLHSARTLAESEIPIVGINLGRLGFLVDISPDDMLSMMEEILAGRYSEECRCLLKTEVIRDGKVIESGRAFNDVVIHKWNSVRMIEFETYIDGKLVNSQRSDGMVVSTPTGSTAYALSGGGPLLHPSLKAFALVPICPHTLSNRPIVIASDSEIELVIKEGHHDHARITLDGQTNFGLKDGDHVRIMRDLFYVHLIHPQNHDQFQLLRAKLHWG